MNYLYYALSAVIGMWLLYIIGVQYERGGNWRVLAPVTALALVADAVLNYTLFAVLTLDFPRAGEYTFSRRLSRLKRTLGWRGVQATYIAEHMLDPFSPLGKHIL